MRTTYRNEPLTNEQLQRIAPSAFATQPWGEVSDKYVFIPTSSIIEGMRQAGFQPYSAVQSRTRVPGKSDYTRHNIRFRNSNPTLVVGDTFFEVSLTNSMDRTSAYILEAGAFRLACLNGASVSEALIESFRVRHIGDIINSVVSSAERLIEQAPKAIEAIKTWKSIEMSRDEKHILAEEAQSLRYDDVNVAPSVEQLLQTRRYEDRANDLWTVFNVLQENVVRGGITPRSNDGNRIYVANGEVANRFAEGARRVSRTREIKDLSFSAKVNKGLWSLAEKFAQLKTAA